MLGAQPLYLPLFALSGDAVFAHQAMLVLTYACAFLAALALARDWTGSWCAALVTGTLFAFSPFRMGNLDQLQVLGNYWLPLVPLCARRAVVERGARWPTLLALALVMQALHSYYVGYAAFVASATMVAIVLLGDATARGGGRRSSCRSSRRRRSSRSRRCLRRRPAFASFAPPAPGLMRLYSARPGQTGATAAVLLALATLPFWRRGVRDGVGVPWIVALAAVGIVGHLLRSGTTIDVAGRTVTAPFGVLASFVQVSARCAARAVQRRRDAGCGGARRGRRGGRARAARKGTSARSASSRSRPWRSTRRCRTRFRSGRSRRPIGCRSRIAGSRPHRRGPCSSCRSTTNACRPRRRRRRRGSIARSTTGIRC
jgi:hypothetical protein